VEVKPGESITGLAAGWSAERFVQVKKVEEKPVPRVCMQIALVSL